MKILALEFSSQQRSVAVIQGTGPSKLADRPLGVSELIQTGGVGANILGMIDAALHQSSIEREQIEVIAIGLGPGSYSGIRRAIAVAQGWQLAFSGDRIRLLGIDSTDCLVAQAQEGGVVGRFSTIIDAQRGEFYLATHEISAGGSRTIEPLRLATLPELQEREAAGERFMGPDVARFRNGCVMFPRATTLAHLAQTRNHFVPGEELEPVYLRKPQYVKAQPARKIL